MSSSLVQVEAVVGGRAYRDLVLGSISSSQVEEVKRLSPVGRSWGRAMRLWAMMWPGGESGSDGAGTPVRCAVGSAVRCAVRGPEMGPCERYSLWESSSRPTPARCDRSGTRAAAHKQSMIHGIACSILPRPNERPEEVCHHSVVSARVGSLGSPGREGPYHWPGRWLGMWRAGQSGRRRAARQCEMPCGAYERHTRTGIPRSLTLQNQAVSR